MIEEAMKAVKEAEKQADEIIRNAHREADELAVATATKIRESKAENANRAEIDLEAALAKAGDEGEGVVANARKMAENEAEALKAVAAEKEEQAVQAVLAALIPES